MGQHLLKLSAKLARGAEDDGIHQDINTPSGAEMEAQSDASRAPSRSSARQSLSQARLLLGNFALGGDLQIDRVVAGLQLERVFLELGRHRFVPDGQHQVLASRRVLDLEGAVILGDGEVWIVEDEDPG